MLQNEEDAKDREYQQITIADEMVRISRSCSYEGLTTIGRELLTSPRWLLEGCWLWLKQHMKAVRDRPHITYILIDISQFVHQQFHVAQGKPVCVEQVLERVEKIKKREQHVYVAGEGGKSFRRFLIDDFKGDRGSRPPELKEYEETILKQMPVPIISFPDYESDDVMASFATTASLWGDKVILETTDKDTWQVLSKLVSSRHKGTLFGPTQLMETRQIRPDQAVDWMCLVGKNNVPGCTGIGEKRASEFLAEHGNLWGIKDNLTFTPKLKEHFDAFWPKYELLKKVHTYNRFLPILLDKE